MALQSHRHQNRPRMSFEERRKAEEERRYLERIASLMDTTPSTLRAYAGIKLWEDGANYQKVVKYVNNSQCHENVRLTVVNIHRVWRRGDPKGLFDIPNRMLLWHGTKRGNIPRILDTGFVLPPSNGQMFGAGVYFADRISKSSNYSDSDTTFLLLCEVGLGKIYSCKESHNNWRSAPVGFDSVKGNGIYVPDWTDVGRFMGTKIPFGKTAKCTKYPSHAVNFNEFIVYDPSRIIVRFLVEVDVKHGYSPTILVVPRNTLQNQQANYITSQTTRKTYAISTTTTRVTTPKTTSYSTQLHNRQSTAPQNSIGTQGTPYHYQPRSTQSTCAIL